MASRLVLIRHGETAWSRSGRHTGRTDLALTPRGQDEARLVIDTLAGWTFTASLSSPLRRAMETAHIAGFDPALDANLMEWDYGEVEGLRNDDIVAERPGWSKWTHEIPGGEQVADVGARADTLLNGTRHIEGDIAIFAHGHFLSVTIARWLGLDAVEGRRFPLATATVSVLGTKRDDRVLDTLNHRCGPHLDEEGG
jgi:broad specificity phosphatase PhoE